MCICLTLPSVRNILSGTVLSVFSGLFSLGLFCLGIFCFSGLFCPGLFCLLTLSKLGGIMAPFLVLDEIKFEAIIVNCCLSFIRQILLDSFARILTIFPYHFSRHSFALGFLIFCVINGREATAEAIIGLLVFYFFVKIFVRTIWRHNHFKSCFFFIRSCIFNWTACVTPFFTLGGARFFCSLAWLIFWSHVIYLTLKNDFLTLKLTFLCFNSER